MVRKWQYGHWRGRRERRSLRCALLRVTIIRRSHRRRDISGQRFYIGARGLGVCLQGHLHMRKGVLRRWCGLLHGDTGRRVDIVVGAQTSCFDQVASVGNARIIWWAGWAVRDALVLHWRDHGIIGRRHGPVGRDGCWGFTGKEAIGYT